MNNNDDNNNNNNNDDDYDAAAAADDDDDDDDDDDCESKIAAELLGFHLLFESCLKLNEDCLKKFSDENAKEQLKGEDVAELKLIIRTTDKLVDVITEQGKQIEELQQKNFNELNKVSIKKLEENKQETKQWSSLFENKVETLLTNIKKIQE